MVLKSRRKREVGESRRPEDTAAKQQRLSAWTPVMTPWAIVIIFGSLGSVFLVVGLVLKTNADAAVAYRKQYGGAGTQSPEKEACFIDVANAAKVCNVTIRVEEKMKPPIQVFYEIDNFYQNHRRYVKSVDWEQLHRREILSEAELRESECSLLYENRTTFLNPCGLIPNTMFNDVFALTNEDVDMKEDKIAWRSDIRDVMKQTKDFDWGRATTDVVDDDDPCFFAGAYRGSPPDLPVRCAPDTCRNFSIESKFHESCYGYVCRGGAFDDFKCEPQEKIVFHYDRLDKWQYLYQTFPQVVSPIVGTNSEHFAVWARTAALPRFRKLYGRITKTIDKNTDLVFQIENNWDVHAFDGKKFIVVAVTDGGFELDFLANCYIGVGASALFFGLVFAIVQQINPRIMGDKRYIPWLTDDNDSDDDSDDD